MLRQPICILLARNLREHQTLFISRHPRPWPPLFLVTLCKNKVRRTDEGFLNGRGILKGDWSLATNHYTNYPS